MRLGAVVGSLSLAAVVSLSASLLASPARAADLTVAPRPAGSSYIPAQFQWTGFYVGVGLGGGFGTSTFTDPFTGQVGSPSLSGLLLSGITGVNWQIGSFVIGAELDFTGSWAKGSANVPSGDNLQTSVFWTSSITGRLGYAFDRLLLYAKGGPAFDFEHNLVTRPSGVSVFGTMYHTSAWTVGGGVEYAFTDHTVFRIEYDYFKFPSTAFATTGAVGVNLSELIGAVSYKF